MRVWDTGTGEMLATYRIHATQVTFIAWSPDSRRIASADADG